MFTLVNLEHPKNAPALIKVIELGMLTTASLEFS